ncbi:hypothetical protein QQP08_023385 [Theobroma cacao]|nr:hypothetical protein QQP08_023385 [Theobroma cacao]
MKGLGFYVDFTLGFKSKLSLLDSCLSEFRKLAQLSCSSIKLKIGSPFFMQSFPKISLEVPVPVPVQVQAKSWGGVWNFSTPTR